MSYLILVAKLEMKVEQITASVLEVKRSSELTQQGLLKIQMALARAFPKMNISALSNVEFLASIPADENVKIVRAIESNNPEAIRQSLAASAKLTSFQIDLFMKDLKRVEQIEPKSLARAEPLQFIQNNTNQ